MSIVGLRYGDLLLIDQDTMRGEYSQVSSLSESSITLCMPLRHAHDAGAPVTVILAHSPVAPTQNANLGDEDFALFIDVSDDDAEHHPSQHSQTGS